MLFMTQNAHGMVERGPLAGTRRLASDDEKRVADTLFFLRVGMHDLSLRFRSWHRSIAPPRTIRLFVSS